MNKKILILYTSVGLGHKYIALNMAYYLEKAGYEVKLHDVLQLQKGALTKYGEKVHNLINRKFPFIWRWLYLNKTFTDVTLPLRVPLASKNNKRVYGVVKEFQPDAILTTETMPTAIVSSLKNKGLYNGKLITTFSDYHLHRYWLYDRVDLYLANIPEQVDEMKKLGVKQPIAVCGITLQPLPHTDKAAVKQKLNVPADRKIILVSSGSMGIGFPPELLKDFIQQMAKSNIQTHVVVVCGKNEKLKTELDSKNLPSTTVLGFYQPMSDLYAITDLFLTKPGGLSIAEALQADVRTQITHWLPGQEELNYEYLTKGHLVEPVPVVLTAEALVKIVEQRLSSPQPSETPTKDLITQKNHEGEVLLNTIEKLFHGGFDDPENIG